MSSLRILLLGLLLIFPVFLVTLAGCSDSEQAPASGDDATMDEWDETFSEENKEE